MLRKSPIPSAPLVPVGSSPPYRVIQIHLGDLSGTKGIFENYNGRPTFTVKDLPLFWVNKEGTRFVDEGVVYDNVL
ncbi:hypothetical protein [Paenibacillus sp.]|uniref:hypothetical protein n=1 Tax=Paenibacillus sp. TaxID=58172 RepID=UPI0037CCB012